jgi:cyclopropane fatty-acyl-phospholipid synthase-like methyltransferase
MESTMTIDPKVYDADYYKSSNYADYLERADRYKKTAKELAGLLHSLNLIQKDSLIVDYGCAIGFLLEGFKELGYTNLLGLEISEWARTEAQKRGNIVWDSSNSDWVSWVRREIDLLISLDVFEHMTNQEIYNLLVFSKPKVLLVRIPTSTDGGKTFHLEVSRTDPTHINCKTKEQWIELFRSFGYQTFLRLNLFTVYDTPGVTCLLIL